VENLFRDETKKVKKRKKVAKATLSFAMDDEEGPSHSNSPAVDDTEEERAAKRGKFRKNPNVDTSFLPDRDREEEERKERERLRQEWLKKQEDIKLEEIEVTYSYWDGSGHRKSVTVRFPSGRRVTCLTYAPVQERRHDQHVLGKMPPTVPRAAWRVC
jgi:protein FAM50